MENNNQEYNTVTLMLDDNTYSLLEITTISHFFHLRVKLQTTMRYIFTDTRLKATTNLYLRILNLMKNMSLYLKHLTKN